MPAPTFQVGQSIIVTHARHDLGGSRATIVAREGTRFLVQTEWNNEDWFTIQQLIDASDPRIGTLDDPVPYSFAACAFYNRNKPRAIDYDARCAACFLGRTHTIRDHCQALANHVAHQQVRLDYSSAEALRVSQEAQRSAAANWLHQHLAELLNGTPPRCSCAQCR